MRLFSDRAVATQPAFQLTEGNANAIAAICHCLDGIPLALELAAARVRNLPVETIAERLSDRFRVLTGGSRTVLPRQQTLRACIDWSYNLLTEPERALLRSMAVFAGGFTLEGAEAVGASPGVDRADVLELLTQLVDKSLVEFDAKRHRYRLLETVRQYAHELLLASEEHEEASRTRHLEFFLALVGEADAKLYGPEQGDWLARLDDERENLLAAHAWCGLADERADSGLRLVVRRTAVLDAPRHAPAGPPGDRRGARSASCEGAKLRPLPGALCGGKSRPADGALCRGAGIRRRKPCDRTRDRRQAAHCGGAGAAWHDFQ